MKYAISFISALLLTSVSYGYGLGLTNEVVTVNQDDEISKSGIATIEDVTTNAVNVQIAMEKARIAAETAIATTNAIQAIVDNIMSNRVIVYRRGFIDSFAALTIITDADSCAIIHADWKEQSAEQIVVDVYYVCSADVSQIKPNVYTHNTLDGGVTKLDFTLSPEAYVSEPTFYAETAVYGETTYDNYYKVTVTIPNPVSTAHYFLFIKLEGNDPGGTGAQLIVRNGIKGGVTDTFTFGNKVIQIKGGLVKGVTNVE